jgi:hypothetical protein
MRPLFLFVLLVFASDCTCGSKVTKVAPSLGVTPVGLDFGQVKTGHAAQATLTLSARTDAPVTLSGIKLETAEGFTLGPLPTGIDALGQAQVLVTFAPTALQAYAGTLVITSNDAESPTLRVPIVGEGAKPILEVTPECLTARGCTAMAALTPPSIDFGLTPLTQVTPVDASKLPTVNIVNSGPVALTVASAVFAGADAAAFSLAGNSTFPPAGLVLEPGEGRNLQLQFKPTAASKLSYAGQLVIASDDPDHPTVAVALRGALAPNAAPVVCANLVRAVPASTGDGPRDYSSATQWAPLLVAPAAGYDFTLTRDVRPGDLAVFSALSDSSNAAACTSDPEDGRTGLTYAWRIVTAPVGAAGLAFSGASTAQAQLRPVVTGQYSLELSVKDAQLQETTVQIRFAVAVRQDLVVQLQWLGFSDVDLDLHLVRPSAEPFSFFNSGTASKTSGDLNGYAAHLVRSNPGAGYDFDWGQPGSADDPTLNLDDTGSGPLLENISLNFPENDSACATASCIYGVYVHSFNDQRLSAPSGCFLDASPGCHDGEACHCPQTQRCVADSAPIGDAGIGTGKCFVAPQPVVRLFLKGDLAPAKVIPLQTLAPPDLLAVGAPCQMLHVADISWPAKSAIGSLPDGGTPAPIITVPGADGTGRVSSPAITRFGYRQAGGSLQCSPDLTVGTVQWYSAQP